MIPNENKYGVFVCTAELCGSLSNSAQPTSTPKPSSKGNFHTSIFLFFYAFCLLYQDQLTAVAFAKHASFVDVPIFQDSSFTLREEIVFGIYLCNSGLQN